MKTGKNKKVLVTGGSGFIGTNFIRHALNVRPGWRIVNLDSLTYAGNPHNFNDLKTEQSERLHFVLGDVKNEALLAQLFSSNNFDYVVNFAAESHVDRSILGPKVFVDTNVHGTFALLGESLKSWDGRNRPGDFRFIHISTDEVYGSLGPQGYFTEETPYNPSSPYSASKAASDHFVKAYFHTYNLPAIITNCSNNYGPFQFPEKLIPLMILNIIEQNSLPVYGDGKNVRDWIFVSDHCEAVLSAIEKGVPGDTYNVGGNSERQNIDIVHLLCDILDKRLGRAGEETSRRLIQFVGDRPGHDRRYAIDATKIERDLGWRPKIGFEEAIRITVDWYLENMDWVESVRSGEYRKWIEVNYEERAKMS
ncbi:MAG: dTDP-glucose 4,6-dehydratase [Planctomycetes bacterium]|nr:dTDP-glucose 4,6-dehydratase [Planctomycetota bacterium]